MTLVEWSKIRFFTRSEFTCNCCNVEHMDVEFMERLDAIRDALSFPLMVTSGYRCPTHNDRVSNTGQLGPHTTGRAADLNVYGKRAYELMQVAQAYGITGIGLKQTGHHLKRFVHLDNLESDTDLSRNRPWIWTY